MKNLIMTTVLLLSINLNSNAQTKIPPPSYADALKNLKASTAVWNDLKTNYGVASQAEVKIIENLDKSYGFNYSSYALPYNYKFPPDLIIPSFTIITKKQADGSYYEIPVSVVYRRSNYETRNDLGGGNYISYTNTYSYYWCEIGAPTAVGKKMLSLDDRAKLFFAAIDKQVKIESAPDFKEYVKYVIGTDLMNVVQFKNFSEYDNPEFRVTTLNAFEEKWLFNCNVLLAEFNDDRSQILNLSEWNVEIEAYAKQNQGKWEIIGNSQNERPFYFSKKDEIKKIYSAVDNDNKAYKDLYATLENVSTSQLSSSLTVIATPIASETEINNKITNPLREILTSKSTNQPEIKNKLLPLFEPTKANEYAESISKQLTLWNNEKVVIEDLSIDLRRGSNDVEKGTADYREQFVNKPLYIKVFFRLKEEDSKKKKMFNGKMYTLVNTDKAPEDFLSDFVKIGFDKEKGKWFLYGTLNELIN